MKRVIFTLLILTKVFICQADPDKIFQQGLTKYYWYNYSDAIKLFKLAKSQYEGADAESGVLKCDAYIAICTIYQGDYSEGLIIASDGLDIALRNYGENSIELSDFLNGFGKYYEYNESYDTAKIFYQGAVRIKEQQLKPTDPELGDAYVNLGISYDYSGQYDSAIYFYDKGLKIFQENFGNEHPYVEYLHNDMGLVYGLMGNHLKSLQMHQKNLPIRSAMYGENSEDVANTLNNIGVALSELDRHSKSIEYYEKALTIRSNLFEEESAEMATSYYNLGNAQSKNNQSDLGFTNNQKAYDIRRRVLGADHSETLKVLNNLGNIKYDGGEYSDAIRYYNVYLKQAIKKHGDKSSKLISTYDNIGDAYDQLSETDEASASYQKALDLRIYNGVGPDGIAKSYINLARASDSKGNYQSSLELLNIALIENFKTEDEKQRSLIYNNIGTIYKSLAQFESAEENYLKSLELRKKVFPEGHQAFAQSYTNLANLYNETEQFDKALDYANKAYYLNVENNGDEHPSTASAQLNLSAIYGDKGDYRKEIELLNRVLEINKKNFGQNHSNLISVYHNLALSNNSLANFNEAIEYAEIAIKLNESISMESESLADSYNVMGVIKSNMSFRNEAFGYYEDALTIYQKVLGVDHPKTADVMNNIGVAYLNYDEPQLARKYFEQALIIYRKVYGENSGSVASTLTNLGLVEYGRGRYEKAIEHFENSIKLGEANRSGTTPEMALTWMNLGVTQIANLEVENAIESYQKALEIRLSNLGSEHPAVADLYNNLAAAFYSQNDLAKAEDLFKSAEHLYAKALGSHNDRLARVKFNLASIASKHGDYVGSTAMADEAINANMGKDKEPISYPIQFLAMVQKIDNSYLQYLKDGGTNNLTSAAKLLNDANEIVAKAERHLFLEEDKLQFAVYKNLLTNIGIKNSYALYSETGDKKHLKQALFYAERSKSNLLLSSLNATKAKGFSGGNKDLFQRDKEIQTSILSASHELYNLESSPTNQQRIDALKKQIFDLNREHETVINKIEGSSKKYYNLKYQQDIISLAEIQNELLDDNSAAVEYALSDSALQIFVVTKNDLQLIPVAITEQLEKNIKGLRTAMIFKVSSLVDQFASETYQILMEPVIAQLADRGISNLIIVPENILNYLPFEVLKNSGGNYLIEDYAVIYSYSLTLSQVLKNRSVESASKGLLAFAPIFSTENNTMTDSGKEMFLASARSQEESTRSFTKRGEFLSALPGTETEVLEIDKILKNRGVSSEYFLYGDAKEEFIKSGAIKDYRYLHFATHGFVNEDNPAFSGIFMSQDHKSSEDCVLHASEIYDLEINAELVTLSACETGLGRLAFGEGIIGLGRSFLYAGASNLLVSQWKVSDASTSQMMVSFYDKITSGMGKAQALRAAKLELINQEEFQAPYFWAPFILVGR